MQENNKPFGIVFFIFFLLISVLLEGFIKIAFVLFSFLFLILGIINSPYLTKPKKLWLKFGELIHMIISPLILSFIYFFIIFPTKIFLIIIGKDILFLKIKKDVSSYWKVKESIKSDMNNQF